jgi:hypothetical protein
VATLQVYDHPWTEENPAEWWDILARWTEVPGILPGSRYYLSDFSSFRNFLFPDRLGIIRDLSTDPGVDDALRVLLHDHLGGQGVFSSPWWSVVSGLVLSAFCTRG